MPASTAGTLDTIDEFAKFIPTRKNWPAWKKHITSKISGSQTFRAFLEFGAACASEMIAQWQLATSTQRQNFQADVSMYPAFVWQNAKAATDICGTIVTQTGGAVCGTLGSKWHDWKACGYTTEDMYNKQVARIRENFLLQVNLRLCEALITAIYGKDYNEKAAPEAEMFRGVFLSTDVKNTLKDSNVSAKDWLDKPELMPCVRLWALICFQFEGVADIHTCNLLKDLQSHFPSASNGNLGNSAQQFEAELKELLEPYGKTFNTAASILGWLRLCSQEIFIECKAASGVRGYLRARDFLLEKRAFNTTLSEQLMRQAIKLAEETNTSAERLGEKICDADKITKLEALVAKQQEQLKALSADVRPGDGKGKGKSWKKSGGTGGKSNNNNDKKRKEERNKDRDEGKCKKCNRRHQGKCAMDRDIDKELQEAQSQVQHL